jgi:hypothetical protein
LAKDEKIWITSQIVVVAKLQKYMQLDALLQNRKLSLQKKCIFLNDLITLKF